MSFQRKSAKSSRVSVFLDAYIKKRRIDNLSIEERKDLATFTQSREELLKWAMVEKEISNTNALSYACIKYDAQSNLQQYHKLESYILNGKRVIDENTDKEEHRKKSKGRKRKKKEDPLFSKVPVTPAIITSPLINLLFPSFQHTFIDLLVNGYKIDAIDFLREKENLFNDEKTYKHLRSITDTTNNSNKSEFQSLKMDTRALNQYIYEMKTKKYRVTVPESEFDSLLAFIKAQDTMFLLQIINRYMNLIVTTEEDETGSGFNYLGNDSFDNDATTQKIIDTSNNPDISNDVIKKNPNKDIKSEKNKKKEITLIDKFASNDMNNNDDDEDIDTMSSSKKIKNRLSDLYSRSKSSSAFTPPLMMKMNFSNINKGLTQLSISKGGGRVVGCYENSAIKLWEIGIGDNNDDNDDDDKDGGIKRKSLTLRGHTGPVFDAEFMWEDDDWLVSASADKTVRLWKMDEGRDVVVYRGHSAAVLDLASSPIQGQFSSCSADTTVKLWCSDRVYPLRSFIGHTRSVNCTDFHLNGCYMASGGNDGAVRMWDVNAGGRCVRLMAAQPSIPQYTLCFSPDGKSIASAGIDGSIRLWDIGSGTPISTFHSSNTCPSTPHSSTPHPSTTHSSTTHPSTTHPSTTHPSTTHPSTTTLSKIQPIYSIVFDHQTNHLYSGGLGGQVDIWDVKKTAGNNTHSSDLKSSDGIQVSKDLVGSVEVDGDVVVRLNYSSNNVLNVLTKSTLIDR